MKYPSYPKYKYSGVEWLGKVPEHWEVLALKHIVSTPITDGPHETPDFTSEGIPFVSAEAVGQGVIDFTKIRGFISEFDHRRYSRKYHPQRGDIYMVKSGATTGVTAIVDTDIEFNIWSPLAVVRCGFRSEPRFVLNFMRSANFLEAIALYWSFGTQQNIGMGVIENLEVTLPPLPEQHTIATFLDAQTAKIDTLIAKKRELIDKLKEKRAALITRTVTRGLPPEAAKAAGLDPNPRMKDSGVEWLGEVPEHWGVKRLKYISPTITVGIVIEPSKYYEDYGVPCLRSFNVKPNVLIDNNLVYISEESNRALNKSMLHQGDLVVVRSGAPGTTAVVDDRFHNANCIDLIIIKKPSNASSMFISYYLNSTAAQVQFSEGTGGAIQQHFNVTTASRLLIALPPFNEQRSIAEYLDRETAKLDQMTTKVESAIERLQEYRSALITAAVTGKIDVREAIQ